MRQIIDRILEGKFDNLSNAVVTVSVDKKLLIKMSTSFEVILSPMFVIICIK